MGNKIHRPRYLLVDQIRGFAVFLMIIYHFSYNLDYFNWITIDLYNDPLWWCFPRVIVLLFVFSVGISLPLAHPTKNIDLRKYFRRVIKISLAAGLISLVTYFLFPGRWIYFGTLHCIAVCSLLAYPFIHRPKVSLVTALVIILPWVFGYEYPWIKLSHRSMDYIPALPWIGPSLLGIYAYHRGLYKLTLPLPKPISNILSFFGHHSLLIYLLHQLILFGLTFGFTWLIAPDMIKSLG